MQTWSVWERVRGTPAGVLVLGALMAMMGTGLVIGGVYLALARRDTGWMAWVAALAAGPLAIYLALHVLRRSPWTWRAMVILMGLLLASSAARAVMAGAASVEPLAEMAAEAAALVYLTRPRVRRTFGRP